MSAVKVDTQNINIAANDIAKYMTENKRYEEYSKEVIEKIAFEVVEKYKKAVLIQKEANEIVFDDEELFDDIYDYMHKKLKEVFSSADIAYIVNDVFMQIEDLLFDEGLIEYHG